MASGAVRCHQVAACEGKGTGEQSLLENLLDHLKTGDVVLADALLATWWIVEGASRRGADVVMAQHGSRLTDFRRGQRLGQHDHVVQRLRPTKPRLMSAEDYARYPEFISMREVEMNGRILVTTLRDPRFVSARALDTLYRMLWNIEVDFRTIKATFRWMYCVANRRAQAMATAASLADVLPRALSFTGAKRLLNAFAEHRTIKFVT